MCLKVEFSKTGGGGVGLHYLSQIVTGLWESFDSLLITVKVFRISTSLQDPSLLLLRGSTLLHNRFHCFSDTFLPLFFEQTKRTTQSLQFTESALTMKNTLFSVSLIFILNLAHYTQVRSFKSRYFILTVYCCKPTFHSNFSQRTGSRDKVTSCGHELNHC